MFRWGIFGTGSVARKFALGLRALGGTHGVGVVASRSAANARRFATQLGVPTAAESYEAAAGTAGIDAFYIATPPSEHRAHALLCLAAGKPVLIEKPFAASAADAEAIIAAAAQAKLFCMEAMWTRFLPLTVRLKAMLAEGAIGEPRSFSGSFCAPDRVDAARNIFNPALGGGALLHRGVYPLSLAWHLLGPVEGISTQARIGETGVDEDCALSLRHAGGALSSVRASLRAPAPMDMVVAGTAGVIHVAAPIFRPFRMSLTPARPRGAEPSGGGRFEALKEGGLLQGAQQRLDGAVRLLRGRGSQTIRLPYDGNGYHYQAEELRSRVQQGALESPVMPLAESVAIMAAIDRARAQWTSAA